MCSLTVPGLGRARFVLRATKSWGKVNHSTRGIEKINTEKLAQDESSPQSHLGAGEHLLVCIQNETEHEKWL